MSDNPFLSPDSSSQPYVTAGTGVLPGLAKALAIIGIVISAFNLLGGCCGIAAFAGMGAVANSSLQEQMAKEDPEAAAEFAKAMDQAKGQMPIAIGQLAISMLLSAALLAGAIGILKRREQGRMIFVYASIALVVLGLLGWVWSFFNNSMAGMPDDQRAVAIGSMIAGFVIGAIFLGYYIFSIIYFSKPETKAHFS